MRQNEEEGKKMARPEAAAKRPKGAERAQNWRHKEPNGIRAKYIYEVLLCAKCIAMYVPF